MKIGLYYLLLALGSPFPTSPLRAGEPYDLSAQVFTGTQTIYPPVAVATTQPEPVTQVRAQITYIYEGGQFRAVAFNGKDVFWWKDSTGWWYITLRGAPGTKPIRSGPFATFSPVSWWIDNQ